MRPLCQCDQNGRIYATLDKVFKVFAIFMVDLIFAKVWVQLFNTIRQTKYQCCKWPNTDKLI